MVRDPGRLGPALYELLHGHGEASVAEILAQTDGLLPGRSTTVIAQAPDQLEPDADDPFRDPQGQTLHVLYRFTDM